MRPVPLRPVLLLGLAAACGDPPLERCERSVLPECDVHDAACQTALHDHVACVRGVDAAGPAPGFEFLDVDAFIARYDAPYTLTGADAECLHLLTLWPTLPTPTIPRAAPAIYDFERRTVVVVDPTDTRALTRSLAYAQRDADIGGLDTWLSGQATSFDQQIAMLALLGGDGQFFGDVAWYKIAAMEDAALRDHIADNVYYEDDLADFALVARDITVDLRFVRAAFAGQGASYVRDRWVVGDDARIADAFDRPIATAGELMRGQLADAAPPALPAPPAPPSPYTAAWTDRMGAWTWFTFRQRVDPLPEAATPADHLARLAEVAALWQNDRLDCLYDPGTGSAIVVWDIRIDPAVQPFELPHKEGPGVWHSRRFTDHWLWVGGQDGPATDAVAASLGL